MLPVVPLKMILFQSLLLMVAIAVEASVLYRELKLTPKQSVEYALPINYLSTAIGWILFLNFQSVLPQPLKLQLINFIFFDRWPQGPALGGVILASVVIFFVSFFVKLVGLTQLQKFLGDPKAKPPEEDFKKIKFGANRRISRGYGIAGQGSAILRANAFSYSAISLILIIRLLTQGSLNLPVQ